MSERLARAVLIYFGLWAIMGLIWLAQHPSVVWVP